jgi:hypothetical protein
LAPAVAVVSDAPLGKSVGCVGDGTDKVIGGRFGSIEIANSGRGSIGRGAGASVARVGSIGAGAGAGRCGTNGTITTRDTSLGRDRVCAVAWTARAITAK